MTETVTVASSSPMPILIHTPNPNPEKPGLHEPDYAVLNGSRHPSAVHGVGITHGVDAGLFSAWMQANPQLAGVLRTMSEDEFKAHQDMPLHFGHEIGLKAHAEDAEGTDLAGKGSTVTEPGPVSPVDMAASSTTPYDGSPRSQPPAPGPTLTPGLSANPAAPATTPGAPTTPVTGSFVATVNEPVATPAAPATP